MPEHRLKSKLHSLKMHSSHGLVSAPRSLQNSPQRESMQAAKSPKQLAQFPEAPIVARMHESTDSATSVSAVS
jgi:hypothetical protein